MNKEKNHSARKVKNIIIGSGISGMTLALLLAQRNEKVLIIEALREPAPLMNGFKRKSLFFDTGFHYAGGFEENGILKEWLTALDVWNFIGDDAIRYVNEEFIFKNNKQFSFPSHEEELLEAVKNQLPNMSATHATISHENILGNFSLFLKEMKEIIADSPFINPNQQEEVPPKAEHEISLTKKLEELNLPHYLQEMLKARCQLLGIKPDKTSLKHFAVLAEPFFKSCATLHGGGKTIRDAFLKALALYNIEIKCSATVEKFILHDENVADKKELKKIQAIQLENNEIIYCERCFYTGHPKELAKLAPKKAFRPAFLNRIEDLPETPLSFMIFAETSSPYMKNKVLYLLDEDEKNFFNPLENENPIIYLSCGDEKNNRYPITAIATIKDDIPRCSNNYDTWKNEMAQKLLSIIKTRVPELDDLQLIEIATPSTLRTWVKGSTGSLYGISHENQELPLLPVTRIEGFFMAGQNILLPGILGAIVSSVVCAGLIFGHDEILERFRKCKIDA